jgi:GNAT superfamily N-acetyltransferase
MQLQPISRPAPSVAATGALPSLTSEIRCLGQGDRGALAAHLISLPPRDRRTRFGGNSGDEAIRRHCDDLDLEETICFAAFDEAGDMIGAALGFTYGAGAGHHHQVAEIAVSVAPDHRRRGLGADLVACVCGTVVARGAIAAVFEFDPSNVAIRGLIRHLGGRVAPLADSCTIPLSTQH